MAKPNKFANPFYVLLLVAGIVFAVTACSYGVMTVQMLDPVRAADIRQSEQGLVAFMDRHGFKLMMIELAVLAAATGAAIATDGYWTGPAKPDDQLPQQGESNP